MFVYPDGSRYEGLPSCLIIYHCIEIKQLLAIFTCLPFPLFKNKIGKLFIFAVKLTHTTLFTKAWQIQNIDTC